MELKINTKPMHTLSKPFTYLLDGISGLTFTFGWIDGHSLLMALGGLASVAAILNHGQQYLERIRKNKKNKK